MGARGSRFWTQQAVGRSWEVTAPHWPSPWPSFTSSMPKAHFPSETPHPFKWKTLKNPLEETAMPSPCPCLGQREIPAVHHCHTAVTASSSQTEPWGKAKLLKELQTVQQRSVDRAYQRQLLYCRGNSKYYLQETPSALPVDSWISGDLIHSRVRHDQIRLMLCFRAF